jgi:hypothetical protein
VDGNPRQVTVHADLVVGGIMVGNIVVNQIGWKPLLRISMNGRIFLVKKTPSLKRTLLDHQAARSKENHWKMLMSIT